MVDVRDNVGPRHLHSNAAISNQHQLANQTSFAERGYSVHSVPGPLLGVTSPAAHAGLVPSPLPQPADPIHPLPAHLPCLSSAAAHPEHVQRLLQRPAQGRAMCGGLPRLLPRRADHADLPHSHQRRSEPVPGLLLDLSSATVHAGIPRPLHGGRCLVVFRARSTSRGARSGPFLSGGRTRNPFLAHVPRRVESAGLPRPAPRCALCGGLPRPFLVARIMRISPTLISVARSPSRAYF